MLSWIYVYSYIENIDMHSLSCVFMYGKYICGWINKDMKIKYSNERHVYSAILII